MKNLLICLMLVMISTSCTMRSFMAAFEGEVEEVQELNSHESN